jgi:hypothetical protein
MSVFAPKENDVINVAWDRAEKVHDWRNYVFEPLQKIWGTFTIEQRLVIADNAQEIADQEHWD